MGHRGSSKKGKKHHRAENTGTPPFVAASVASGKTCDRSVVWWTRPGRGIYYRTGMINNANGLVGGCRSSLTLALCELELELSRVAWMMEEGL